MKTNCDAAAKTPLSRSDHEETLGKKGCSIKQPSYSVQKCTCQREK